MHNFKMLPAIVIPSLMLLSSVAFIIFAVQHTLPEEVSYFLKENSSFLPYLSLISVAVAFVVGAVIVRFISVFFKKIDQSDAYATILQYGSVELIRSLDDTYKVVIMLRLLYGSIPLFCVGLLSWMYFWTWFMAIILYTATLLFLVVLAKLNPTKGASHDWKGLKQFVSSKIFILGILLGCIIWLILVFLKQVGLSINSVFLMIVHVFSGPLLFWVHYATIRDHDRRRDVFRKTIQMELDLKYFDKLRNK